MAQTDKVKLQIKGHGYYETDAHHFDELIAELLPTSVEELRAKLQRYSDEQHGGGIDYSDLETVTECLFVFGELYGYATN
ncbi:hypothetical protein [Streptomyces sp. NPDC004135]